MLADQGRLPRLKGRAAPALFVLAAGALAAGAFPWSAEAAALAPHRAAYELELVPDLKSELTDLQGGLVIEWEATCELWLSHQRMAFIATGMDGEPFRHDVRYSSVEALAGDSLRFTVRTYEGDQLVEEFRGQASTRPNGEVVATFQEPAAEQIDLPAGTVFPTAHLVDVLKRAERGETLVTHRVFDGWGYDALTQVTTVIGERRVGPLGAGDPAGWGWPVSMAYYELKSDDQSDLPDFEATFLLSANGILHDLELNYGDFAVAARLSELEIEERPGC